MKYPIETIRHTLAHVMASTVQQMFPDTKFGIGPVIENGFYYDFDSTHKFTEEDFAEIEKKMQQIIKDKIAVEHIYKPADEAIDENKASGQTYKVELLEEIKKGDRIAITDVDIEQQKDGNLSFYKIGDFIDLCKGPHVENTSDLPKDGFKLTHVAGAYWRGKETNPMMQRIYVTAFNTKKELDEHLALIEEAKKRDHRIIGQNLNLFVFSELVGKGLPLLTEKGSVIRRELERYIVDKELSRGYKHVYTPEIAKVDLYRKSGHYPYYKDSMYPVMKVDEEELILRPMTCPHHFQLYASKPRSYRDLPIRYAELAKQFRYEKSGELTGLMRVRLFCLADAHIICRPDQASDEVNSVLNLIEEVAGTIGLKKGENYQYRLSLGDRSDDNKKYFKDDEAWDKAENVLRKVLTDRKAPFYEGKGEAAFYGPKIDIQMKNFIGKEDTAFTVQYDFVMPKRFELTYIDNDGKEKEAVVIHRSALGAFERVMAFLIERYAGALPLWLSPVQASIIPISDKQQDFAKKVYDDMIKSGIRVELNDANETLGKRIREDEMQKIPYLLVIGDKEVTANAVAIRQRGKGDIGQVPVDIFITQLQEEIKEKK
jgi:threonyl-tRNA synthetase